MLARDRHPLPRSFLTGAPSPSRKLEGDKAVRSMLEMFTRSTLVVAPLDR